MRQQLKQATDVDRAIADSLDWESVERIAGMLSPAVTSLARPSARECPRADDLQTAELLDALHHMIRCLERWMLADCPAV